MYFHAFSCFLLLTLASCLVLVSSLSLMLMTSTYIPHTYLLDRLRQPVNIRKSDPSKKLKAHVAQCDDTFDTLFSLNADSVASAVGRGCPKSDALVTPILLI